MYFSTNISSIAQTPLLRFVVYLHNCTTNRNRSLSFQLQLSCFADKVKYTMNPQQIKVLECQHIGRLHTRWLLVVVSERMIKKSHLLEPRGKRRCGWFLNVKKTSCYWHALSQTKSYKPATCQRKAFSFPDCLSLTPWALTIVHVGQMWHFVDPFREFSFIYFSEFSRFYAHNVNNVLKNLRWTTNRDN